MNTLSVLCSVSLLYNDLHVNMALRAQNNNSPLFDSVNNFNVTFWSFTCLFAQGEFQPHNNWDKWLDLFQVTILAKSSTSITELNREVTQQTPGAQAIVGDMKTLQRRKWLTLCTCSWGKQREIISKTKNHTRYSGT